MTQLDRFILAIRQAESRHELETLTALAYPFARSRDDRNLIDSAGYLRCEDLRVVQMLRTPENKSVAAGGVA